MQQLQAIIQGQLPPLQTDLEHLITLAEQHPQPASSEFKLLEMVLNIVLASYLEQALEYV